MPENSYITSKWKYEDLDVSGIRRKYRDVKYFQADDCEGMLDLYLPESFSPVPLILVISGGGWYFGRKSTSHLGSILETALEEGFALASLACTSSGKKTFPWQIYEAKAAVRYLRSHADQYGLNPDAFAFWSPSSGAHLSLMEALTCDLEEFDSPVLGYHGISSEVQAVVATYPPTDLSAFQRHFQELGIQPLYTPVGAGCNEGIFLGAAPESHPELALHASPISYITPEAPPVFLQHGGRDRTVPVLQSFHFYTKYCRIVGQDKIRFQFIDDADHSDPRFKSPETCRRICEFLHEVLNA